MSSPTWTAMNKNMALYFKKIRRPYSEIEAHFSLSLDVNCGKVRSIRAYSRMWDWSPNRTTKFLKDSINIETEARHLRDSSETDISVILLNNKDNTRQKRDRSETEARHKYKEQRIKKKKNTMSYSDEFEEFWSRYPRKTAKLKAFASWNAEGCGNGLFSQVMDGLDACIKAEDWDDRETKYIPHPTTWINQRRWEDHQGEYHGAGQPKSRFVVEDAPPTSENTDS